MKKFSVSPAFSAAAFCVLIIVCWAGYTLLQRSAAERKNNTVELCLDWAEASDLCYRNNYSIQTFLGRAQAIGAASVSFDEETLGSFVSSGKVLYFGQDEYQRLKLLELLEPGANITGECLLVSDKVIAEQLKRQLVGRHHIPLKVTRFGKYTVLAPVFAGGQAPSYWNAAIPLGCSPDNIRAATEAGLKIVLRPLNLNEAYFCFQDTDSAVISAFMNDGKEVPGYPGGEPEFARRLRQYGIKQVPVEFSQVYGSLALEAAAPELIVRAHTVTVPEMNKNLTASFWITRFRRAARERGLRFLYVHIWANKSIEDNLIYLRSLAQGLKSEGFRLGYARPPDYPARGAAGLWSYLALILACTGPIAAFMLGKQLTGKPILQYTLVNVVTFATALSVGACLYDVLFMQKVVDVPGVKLAMLLPLAVAAFVAYKPAQIKAAMQFQLKVWHLLAAMLAIGAVAIMLARSGNFSAEWMHPDSGIRSTLEDILTIRPRTKELLFGQPLLYLGFAFSSPLLTLIGFVGQISIVNTFMHAHSPVFVSVVRTIYGQVLGLLIGLAAAFVYRRFIRSKK